MVFLSTVLKSFPQAALSCEALLDLVVSRERLERLAQRVGGELVEQRRQQVAAARDLTLKERCDGPVGVIPPVACAVTGDGGRAQLAKPREGSKSHWTEFKAGLLLELGSHQDANDPSLPDGAPCPEVPGFLLNFERVETLTKEMAQLASSPVTTLPENSNSKPLEESETAKTEAISQLLSAAAQATQKQRRTTRDLPLSPRIIALRRRGVRECWNCSIPSTPR